MKRISTATSVPNKFGAGKNGFTNGSVIGGVPATDLDADWFDHMQEEVASVIEDRGIVLDPNNRKQLLEAVRGRLMGVQLLTVSGTFYRPKGAKSALVWTQAGGGGGGSSAGAGAGAVSVASGGGGGSWGLSYIDDLTAAGVNYTVGAGGAGGTGGGPGGAGGTTGFYYPGLNLLAPGGDGGISSAPTNTPVFVIPGANSGFANNNNLINASCSAGTYGAIVNSSAAVAGSGGSSYFGNGPRGSNVTGVGGSGSNFGCGGAGALSGSGMPAQAGGNGAPGAIMIWVFA